MNGSVNLLACASVVFCGGLALAVASHRRGSAARWAFVCGMAVFALENLGLAMTVDAASPGAMVEWQNWKLAVAALSPGVWLLFSVSYARGNGWESVKRWRWTLGGAFLIPMGLVVLSQDELVISGSQPSPDHCLFRLGLMGTPLNVVSLVCAVLTLMNLERTYRAAIGTMLWRIKFIILGLGLIFAVRAYASSEVLLFHSMDLSLEAVTAAATLLGSGLVLRGLLRAGHFSTDVYPSQAALHNSLTLLLAGAYLLIVGVFAKIVVFLGGDSSFMLKAFFLLIALILAAVVALSDRVRLQARQFMSRHFQRPLYDYRSVWRTCSESTAACVQPLELCQATAKLLTDFFQVLSVSIWLVNEKKEDLVFATSTVLSEAQANRLKPSEGAAAEIVRGLEGRTAPIDLDATEEGWTAALRACHPDEFHKGGHRLCVPLTSGGAVLGLIILGDRVSGLHFAPQDFDLLKCVADQVGGGLQNVQLSRKLLAAREMEAFQTMASFFVHDLKNTTFTLNLMLANLPEHFDDPEFRADALRGIAATVANINRLIGRLSQLRQEFEIKTVESDLNEVVTRALAAWQDAPGVTLRQELGPLPRISLDQEQMLKVVTNLLVNAREAVAKTGEIRISTARQNGAVILTVSDTGCGMPPEFLKRSLFRPFQTTKKHGLGIGLFQSKMIVEAHRGSVQVESEPNHGTTFRINLPVSAPAS